MLKCYKEGITTRSALDPASRVNQDGSVQAITTHINAYVHTHMHKCTTNNDTYTRATCMQAHTHTYTRTYTHMYTLMHTHTHTYTHMYTLMHKQTHRKQ